MDQIKLITAPVIKHDLYAVGASVTARIEELNIENQVATEETVGTLKKLRAELNKELAEYETQRKAIKEAVTAPYSELEAVYKAEVSDKYKAAADLLKDKITEVEDRIKSNILEEVKSFFVELCLSEDIDFLSWNQLGIDIKLSDSMKSYKDRIIAIVEKVKDELALIDTQNYKAEILVEYKKTLNAAKAIKEIQDRKEAEKRESDRIKLVETQRRGTLLRDLGFVYRDITRTYEHINHSDIYILEPFVENSTKEQFELKIAEMKIQIINLTTTFDAPPTYPPLKAPEVIKPEIKEEVFTASFEVSGTMNQLRQLGEFLKSNNITYKNI